MKDEINEILKALSARGVTYFRFYNGDQVRKRGKDSGWFVKCVRHRADGSTIELSASGDDPLSALEELVKEINNEANRYLDRVAKHKVYTG